MPTLEVIRTYLRMTSPAELLPGRKDDARARVERLFDCPAVFFRQLYVDVGSAQDESRMDLAWGYAPAHTSE